MVDGMDRRLSWVSGVCGLMVRELVDRYCFFCCGVKERRVGKEKIDDLNCLCGGGGKASLGPDQKKG